MDPQIGTFDPAVQSPKLLAQVAVVTAACGFFGIGALSGLVNLVQMLCVKRSDPALVPDPVKELTVVNRRSLWIGLILMIVGACVSMIMAGESSQPTNGVGTQKRHGK
jgi:ABC-type transport system involved in cytochrome c biogenesis permease subunit